MSDVLIMSCLIRCVEVGVDQLAETETGDTPTVEGGSGGQRKKKRRKSKWASGVVANSGKKKLPKKKIFDSGDEKEEEGNVVEEEKEDIEQEKNEEEEKTGDGEESMETDNPVAGPSHKVKSRIKKSALLLYLMLFKYLIICVFTY